MKIARIKSEITRDQQILGQYAERIYSVED